MKSLLRKYLAIMTVMFMCLGISVGWGSDTEATWELRYQFRAGQELRFRTRQTTTLEAMAGENRKTDKTEVEHRQLLRVTSVEDDGRAHVTMQFEHVRMQSQTDDLPPSLFDSSMKPEEVPSQYRQTSRQLMGPAARFVLNPMGNGSADGTKQPASGGPTATGPAAESAAEPAPVAKAENSQTADAGFLMPLPTEAVRIGDTWKDTQTVKVRVTKDINRSIEILRSFRLVAVEGGIAQIAFNSSISSQLTHPGVRAQLIQSTPKGTLHFDIARGVMIRKQWKFDQSVINAMGENTVVTSWGDFLEELIESPDAAGATSEAGHPVENSPVASSR